MYLDVSPYQESLAGITAALASNTGIITLTGPYGTGKTALAYQLSERLQQQGRQVVFFLHAPRNPDELHTGILRQLHLREQGNFARRLTDYLLSLAAGNRCLHVLIDEAEHLDTATCHAISMLRDLQHEAQALVGVVLLGSPELDLMLTRAMPAALTQHVNYSVLLQPMQASEVLSFCQAYWQANATARAAPDESWTAELLQLSGGLPGAVLAELGDEEHRDEINISARLAHAVAAEQPQSATIAIPAAAQAALAKTSSPVLLPVVVLLLLAGVTFAGYRWLQPAVVPAVSEQRAVPAIATAAAPSPSPSPSPVIITLASSEPVLPAAVEAGIIAEAEVVRLLNGWVQNWQAQNLPGYFASYGADFVPESSPSRAAWEAERRRIIAAASGVRVGWRELQIRSRDAQTAVVELWLDYASSSYSDRTLKELTLGFENDQAVILRERNLTVQP